jgi:phosphoribosylanthranilate isomerase
MPVKIKICGLRRAADVAACNAALPDYIGFVFAQQSKRYVTPQEALQLRKQLAPGILPVGVFVNAEIDFIERLYDNGVIKLAQLHGQEDARYIRQLQAVCAVPIIQVLQVTGKLPEAPSTADFLLLDSGAGSGEPFDWSLATPAATQQKPWFLAGGISLANLDAALALQPYAIDVSSGAETGGWKDAEKISALVERVRGA